MAIELLVTGFEPFGGYQENPSWDGLEAMLELPSGVVTRQLPVSWQGVDDLIPTLIEELQPRRMLMLGVHGGGDTTGGRDSQAFYVESQAINQDAAPIADNSGESRQNTPIEPEFGIDFIRRGDACPELASALIAQNFSALASEDAGRYLCNHSYYRALALRDTGSSPTMVSFVHVPPSNEMRNNGMDRKDYPKAYEILINTLLALAPRT